MRTHTLQGEQKRNLASVSKYSIMLVTLISFRALIFLAFKPTPSGFKVQVNFLHICMIIFDLQLKLRFTVFPDNSWPVMGGRERDPLNQYIILNIVG